MINQCLKCDICRGRKNIVNASGDFDHCKIMFIGQGPGAVEDKTGIPFVGPAGRLLMKFFKLINLDRDKYIVMTNVIKCKTPGNRVPMINEINNCLPYLQDEINTYNPKVIVILGDTAMKAMLGYTSDTISKRRGTYIVYDNRIFFFTYHPSYVLRNMESDKILNQYVNDFQFISKLYKLMI